MMRLNRIQWLRKIADGGPAGAYVGKTRMAWLCKHMLIRRTDHPYVYQITDKGRYDLIVAIQEYANRPGTGL